MYGSLSGGSSHGQDPCGAAGMRIGWQAAQEHGNAIGPDGSGALTWVTQGRSQGCTAGSQGPGVIDGVEQGRSHPQGDGAPQGGSGSGRTDRPHGRPIAAQGHGASLATQSNGFLTRTVR